MVIVFYNVPFTLTIYSYIPSIEAMETTVQFSTTKQQTQITKDLFKIKKNLINNELKVLNKVSITIKREIDSQTKTMMRRWCNKYKISRQ